MELFIVTGISSGLGEEIVNLLTQNNKNVIGIGRNFTSAQNTLSKINPKLLTLIQCDLANTPSCRQLIQELDSEISSGMEITFINNAGVIDPITKVGNFMENIDVERHINVNYLTPVLLTNYLLSKHQNKMKIINISSGAAELSIEGWSLYCSSKKAIKTFLDVVNKENIHLSVEHIDPGVMNTKMQGNIRKSSIEHFPEVNQFKELEERGKLQSPEETARKILKGYLIE